MAKLKALIADDEAPARNRMAEMLKNFEHVELVNISSNGVDALNNIILLKPDVAFLDIEMPGMNGLEVVENIPEDVRTRIIFATAYNEYAIKAFELNAIDYLLKPFNKERLAQSIEKLPKNSANQSPAKLKEALEQVPGQADAQYLNKIPVPAADRFKLLDIDQIICIEVEDRNTFLYTMEKSYMMSGTLDSFEKKLPEEMFLRVSRSAIINLNAIKELVMWFSNRYKIILKNDKEVISSRERSRQLKQILQL